MSKSFDTKIAVVVRGDLPTWQKLNVVAFTISGIAGAGSEVIGEPYEDASGNTYLPMLRQPVLVFSADCDGIHTAYQRARESGTHLAIFVEELFRTGCDEDNRAAMRVVPEHSLKVVGMAMRDRKKVVDKIVRGLTLHG